MSWELIVAGVIVALLAYVVRRQTRELAALRVEVETERSWAQHWEQMAEQAAEEAEMACKRYTTLQGLYTRLVREQLAQNWPLIVEYRKWARR